jgi:hypothetical protein
MNSQSLHQIETYSFINLAAEFTSKVFIHKFSLIELSKKKINFLQSIVIQTSVSDPDSLNLDLDPGCY